MDAGLVTLGTVGALFSLVMLYYATGVLLHFVTFDADTTPDYMDRLRLEGSFDVLLASIILYATGISIGGAGLYLDIAYASSALILGFVSLLFGMLYFLRRMMRITAL